MSQSGIQDESVEVVNRPRSKVIRGWFSGGKRLRLSTKQRRFLLAYQKLVSIDKASKKAGIWDVEHYRWLESSEDYSIAFQQVWQALADRAEESAYKRAFTGYEEPLSYKGELTGDTITKYSDQLAAKMLAGLKPEKYKESAINVNTSGPVAVQIVQPSVQQPPVPVAPQRASQAALPADPAPPAPIYEQDSPEHIGDTIARFRPGYK